MSAASLFIGVVSHEGTRFPAAQGPEGLAALLSAQLTDRGVPHSVVVDVTNRWDTAADPIKAEDVQGALSAQVNLGDEWSRYLRGHRPRSVKSAALSILRRGKRRWRRFAPPPTVMVERLLNIELAHTALLDAGVASGAQWMLILEDDAFSDDVCDLADGLVDLIKTASKDVQFVNLSESFDVAELGIARLLVRAPVAWKGTSARTVLSASRPVTNTVCAIAYRSDFAQRLLDVYAQMPIRPVVPIDWKLNAALMQMFGSGELGEGSCWWVVPGPIDQLSMRDDP